MQLGEKVLMPFCASQSGGGGYHHEPQAIG
jgi:hypothetical protein